MGAALLLKLLPYILIALLVATNVGLWKLHSHDLEKIGELKSQAASVKQEAMACSAATAELQRETFIKNREITGALALARQKSARLEAEANAIMQMPAASADSCAAGLQFSRKMLLDRKKP